jgi:hypothetical protein
LPDGKSTRTLARALLILECSSGGADFPLNGSFQIFGSRDELRISKSPQQSVDFQHHGRQESK